MLKRLLALIGDGDEALSVERLARELNVPPLLVVDVLERLVDEGYLTCLLTDGSVSCAGCTARYHCLPSKRTALWQPTEKARCLLSTPDSPVPA